MSMFQLESNVRTALQHNQRLFWKLSVVEAKLDELLRSSGIDPQDVVNRLRAKAEADQQADGEGGTP